MTNICKYIIYIYTYYFKKKIQRFKDSYKNELIWILFFVIIN